MEALSRHPRAIVNFRAAVDKSDPEIDAVMAPCVLLCLLGGCRLGNPERRYWIQT
jgi:hypothetical protein